MKGAKVLFKEGRRRRRHPIPAATNLDCISNGPFKKNTDDRSVFDSSVPRTQSKIGSTPP